MKTCTQCKETKSKELFYRNKNTPDGFQHQCKSCANKATHRSQKRKPEKYRAARKRVRDKFVAEMRAYKVKHGCAHCGENHEAVLELHHTDPTVKDVHPSDSTSRKIFYEEVEKCIVLCANCHRKLHYEHRRGVA